MLSIVSLVLLVIFRQLIDSGTLVANMLTSQPSEHEKPVARVSVFWAFLWYITTILLRVGGLQTLQTLMIAGAFHYVVMLLYYFCIFKQPRTMLQSCVQTHHSSGSSQSRYQLKRFTVFITSSKFRGCPALMDTVVVPALSQLSHRTSRPFHWSWL